MLKPCKCGVDGCNVDTSIQDCKSQWARDCPRRSAKYASNKRSFEKRRQLERTREHMWRERNRLAQLKGEVRPRRCTKCMGLAHHRQSPVCAECGQPYVAPPMKELAWIRAVKEECALLDRRLNKEIKRG